MSDEQLDSFDEAEPAEETAETDQEVIRTAQGGKWTYGPVHRRLHEQLDEIGAKRRGLHVFRHTGATFYANDAGMPIAQLQKFLGHQRLAETQRYLHPSPDDVATSLARVDFARLTRLSESSHA